MNIFHDMMALLINSICKISKWFLKLSFKKMREREKSPLISFSILTKNKGTSEKHSRVKQVLTMFSCIVKYITPYKEIWDSSGFWIPFLDFGLFDRVLIVERGFWNSGFLELDTYLQCKSLKVPIYKGILTSFIEL